MSELADFAEREAGVLDAIASNLRKFPGDPTVALAQAGNIDESARALRRRVETERNCERAEAVHIHMLREITDALDAAGIDQTGDVPTRVRRALLSVPTPLPPFTY